MGSGSSRESLTRDDLEFLQRKTSFDKETILDFYKGFIADCPEGKLSPNNFCNIYSKCFPSGNTKEFCDHVFRTFDTDRNGFIDFKEFLLSIDVTSSGTPTEKLEWAFRMYDVDGNGWIDLGEMTKLVASIYTMLGQHQLVKQESASDRARTIFEKMDVNSDGKVTREEFMRSCLDDENMINLLTPPGM